MPNKIDLTGQVFGRLTVIEPAPSLNRATRWVAQCSCGKELVTRTASLLSGRTNSCGCLKLEIVTSLGKSRLTDLTGQTFGRLTAINRGPDYTQRNGRTRPQWRCACVCGSIMLALSENLVSGNTTSCGCQQADTITRDLTGMQFGKLTALARIQKTKKQPVKWLCRCECGNECIVGSRELKAGNTKSCGCLKRLNGPDSPHWKHNIPEKDRAYRRLRTLINSSVHKAHAKLAKLIFERDNYTCQHCGHRGKTLAAHHILPWATYPDLRYATENCIVLCKDCHNEFHSMYGREDFDDEDLKDYLT